MKVKCNSGKEYVLNISFGALSDTQGAIFEGMSDDTMDKIGKRLDKDGAGIEQFKDKMLVMGGDVLKGMLSATGAYSARILAHVLDSVDGQSLGETPEERLKYINNKGHRLGFLDAIDGMEISTELEPHLTRFQDAIKVRQEKSASSSKDKNGAGKAQSKSLQPQSS